VLKQLRCKLGLGHGGVYGIVPVSLSLSVPRIGYVTSPPIDDSSRVTRSTQMPALGRALTFHTFGSRLSCPTGVLSTVDTPSVAMRTLSGKRPQFASGIAPTSRALAITAVW
jgi:hypothetical protein